jgi:xanthine dehydrogenase accessory factor
MKLALLEKAVAASRAGRPAALATNLKNGMQILIEGVDIEGNLKLDSDGIAAVRVALAADRCDIFDSSDGQVFVEVFNPPLKLVIVGAVHIAQPLARMAALAGYAVTLVDPRTAFATAERFPGVELSTAWPDEALAKLKPDRRSAVVTLTHDPKLDDPALVAALRSSAFYIGSLGSKKTHAARLARLVALGFKDADLARINGPVGLDIGAVSPAEIAVSILAQITATLRAEKIKARDKIPAAEPQKSQAPVT